jgi:hypothetical protein
MESIRKAMFKFAQQLLAPSKDTLKKEKPHSIFALMPDGSMKKGSLGLIIYKELLRAYSEDYEDDVDKEAIFYAISGNYIHETESAWQAFLAKINFDE